MLRFIQILTAGLDMFVVVSQENLILDVHSRLSFDRCLSFQDKLDLDRFVTRQLQTALIFSLFLLIRTCFVRQ